MKHSARAGGRALAIAAGVAVVLAAAEPASASTSVRAHVLPGASRAEPDAAIHHRTLEAEAPPVPAVVAKPVGRAGVALKKAERRLSRGLVLKARRSLRLLRKRLTTAHEAGMAQIGAPPLDPESDDLPGPPSVLAVLALEDRVTVRVVRLFDGRRNEKLVRGLRKTLVVAHGRRDEMLDAVIALPPEGDGADYADGMADTLPIYDAEVTAVTSALAQYRLVAPARRGLRNALDRVTATRDKVNQAWGGGE